MMRKQVFQKISNLNLPIDCLEKKNIKVKKPENEE